MEWMQWHRGSKGWILKRWSIRHGRLSSISHSCFTRMLSWSSAPDYFPSRHFSIIFGSNLQQALQCVTQLVQSPSKSLWAQYTTTSLTVSVTIQSQTRNLNNMQAHNTMFSRTKLKKKKVHSFTSNTRCKCNVHPLQLNIRTLKATPSL